MMLKPDIVVLELTNRCNLQCKHCSLVNNRLAEATKELETEEWYKIVEVLKKVGARKVILSGGEPLLRGDFFSILHKACERFASVGITSNGTCMTENTVSRLIDNGAKEIQFSVDGVEVDHDFIRGKGSFNKVLKSIGLAKAAGMNVFTMTVLSKVNLGSIERMLRCLFDMGVNGFSFERLTPVGRGANIGGLCLHRDQIKVVFEKILSMKDRYQVSLNDPLQALLYNNSDAKRDFTVCGGCVAGFLNFAVDMSGNVKPCTRLPHAIGSVLVMDWGKMLDCDLSRRLLLRDFNGKCGSCDLIFRCGGCRAEAFAYNGDIFGEDPGCWKGSN